MKIKDTRYQAPESYILNCENSSCLCSSPDEGGIEKINYEDWFVGYYYDN